MLNPKALRPTHRMSRLAKLGLVAGVAAVTVVPTAAFATTSATPSDQVVTFTSSPLISITASPVSLGSITPGASVPVNLGSVLLTDTLADSTAWTASVQASNCFLPTAGLPANLNTANATIPASAITYAPPSTGLAPTVPLSTTPVSAVGGTTQSFANPSTTGSLTAPTFGAAMTVATAAYDSVSALDNDGTYTLTPTMSLNLASNSSFVPLAGSAYTCTLQYTALG